jgi:hypothetical protein
MSIADNFSIDPVPLLHETELEAIASDENKSMYNINTAKNKYLDKRILQPFLFVIRYVNK